MNAASKPASGAADLWLRWVLANAVGEAAGLSITALVGVAAILYAGEGTGVLATLALPAPPSPARASR